jgi:hypothetical protein
MFFTSFPYYDLLSIIYSFEKKTIYFTLQIPYNKHANVMVLRCGQPDNVLGISIQCY